MSCCEPYVWCRLIYIYTVLFNNRIVTNNIFIAILWMSSLDVEKLDVSIIRAFYDQYKKSYHTCALFRVLEYMEKYSGIIFGYGVSTDNISLDRP